MDEDTPMAQVVKATNPSRDDLLVRRVLRGHFGKVYACAWSSDSEHLVSASQDGKLLIWNCKTGLKKYAISLQSSWVMAADYSPSGRFVASGGLDNMVSVYEVKMEEAVAKDAMPVELLGHEGYVASCTFLDDENILSTSGDSTCVLWDIEKRASTMRFLDHQADVMSASLIGGSRRVFVSGSTDASVKLWDMRSGDRAVKEFMGHESDINSVKAFKNGKSFISGSDDSTCMLWDIRSNEEYLQKYSSDRILCGVTSVDVSSSGKYSFAAYDEGIVRVWDTLSGKLMQDMPHEGSRCSTVRVAPNGQAVISATWDNLLRIWA